MQWAWCLKTVQMAQLGESRAADAFGNALGNSIVRQSQQSYADKVAEQERMSAAIGAIGSGAVNGR